VALLNGMERKSLLLITGTMGAGKTSVLGEASDILTLENIVHAAIDLDAFGLAHLSSADASNDVVMYRNLQAVCKNYAALGVRRFLVARAMEDRTMLEACRRAVSAKNTVVCRLTASTETMRQRVKMRESGVLHEQFIARVEKLNSILDRALLEDFTLASEDRSVNQIAREMLLKAGWIQSKLGDAASA
jgi:ribose 1,5-bisphosphokinase PhnN